MARKFGTANEDGDIAAYVEGVAHGPGETPPRWIRQWSWRYGA